MPTSNETRVRVDVFWNSIPLDTLQAWATSHGDAGMAATLNDSLETARFRLDEKNRLVAAADRIAGGR